MWRFLKIICFLIYGTMTSLWFGWNLIEPKFWAILTLMIFACAFTSEEERISNDC